MSCRQISLQISLQVSLQVLSVAALASVSWAHLLGGDGFHHWRYDLPGGPHPLALPPFHPPPRNSLPLIPLQPPQVILVPVHVRGTFPPFIERIVQRIQTWWSFYNPPEVLTRPPPTGGETDGSKKKTTPTTKSAPTTTTPAPKDVDPTEFQGVDTTTPDPETTTSSVSTLAVYEVTPSTSAAEDTEEPLFITPERASLLGGRREAYLKFLQTGTLPPYLEEVNEAETQ